MIDWKGALLPLLMQWFPNLTEVNALAIVGLAVSLGYALARKINLGPTKAAARADLKAEPNIVNVAIPSLIGGLLAGLPGLLIGAVGDGLRRAGWAAGHWIGRRFGWIEPK